MACSMAIAVMPEPPRDRWDRLVTLGMIAIIVLILGLFVFSMLDSYVL
jgi:hypothetical protein